MVRNFSRYHRKTTHSFFLSSAIFHCTACAPSQFLPLRDTRAWPVPRRFKRGTSTMVTILDPRLLALTAIVTVAFQLSFFLVTYTCKFDTLTDFAGSTNFILVAALTLALGAEYSLRAIVLSTFVFVWGTRLCAFLLMRILQWGEDRRFDDKREDLAKLAAFWSVQAVWVWTVSLPVTIVNTSNISPRLGTLDFLGWVLFGIGFALESVADQQKTNYKKKPESRGRWTDVGTWAWSRHPNYAGEITLWWGIYISSTRVLRGWEHLAVLGPIFITCILLFVSGIPLLESSADKKHGQKHDYLVYKRRTSVLFPVPPALYERFPDTVKKSIFFDLPLYNKELNKDVRDVEKGAPDPPAENVATEQTD